MTSKSSLLVFSDDWGRHPSSCQHLVRHLGDRWRILWVNTIGTRKIRANGFTVRRVVEKLRGWQGGMRQVADQMWVVDLPMLPPSPGVVGRAVNRKLVGRQLRKRFREIGFTRPLVLTTVPYTSWLIDDVETAGLVYNCTDDYSHWPGADRETLLTAEAAQSERADLILAASAELASRFAGHRRCEVFHHAVEYEHFARARDPLPAPPPVAALSRPRVAFFGLIYEKVDFALLTRLAHEVPHVSLLMIGPVDYCPASFRRLPNVHLLGRQPYEQLPNWLSACDVLILPYVLDEMILRSSPLKLRECLATGKPTVSVNVPEVRKLEPHVRVASDCEEFIDLVRRSSGEEPVEAIDARQQAVARDSWRVRADELHARLLQIAEGSVAVA